MGRKESNQINKNKTVCQSSPLDTSGLERFDAVYNPCTYLGHCINKSAGALTIRALGVSSFTQG